MGKSEIKVSCKDQVLKITEAPVLAAGGLNEVRVVFSFCEKWVGFIKTAIFYRDEEEVYYAVLDENDTCLVPWEVCYEEGTFYFGVFGERDNTRRTSNVVRYKVKKGAITSDMKPSAPPPDVYEQIMTEVAKVKEATKYNIAGAKAYQIIDKGATDTLVNGSDGYYLLCADEVPIEELTGQDYSITIQTTYELAGKIVGVGQIETGLTGIDENGNHVSGLTGFKVYVNGYKDDLLLDNTSQHWNETRNTFRIPYLPHLGTKDYGKGAWAEGFNTQSVSIGSHAEGDTTKALGKYAHVQNADNIALYCGHAEGRYNEARGNVAHAQGLRTKALGTASHSAGTYTVAAGDYSHAGGMFTRAHYEAQTALGHYNLNKPDNLLEVGVGSGEFDRVNGLEVKKDGSARVLTESTEPDAVVRYSQLEKTAVGFTKVVDTAISLDFEADAVGQTPAGWTEVTPSTDPKKYYVKVEDDSGNQVLGVNSVNASGADYFVQYSLPEKVTNLKLEYRVMLRPNSPTAYELYLPTINYTGVATNSNNKSTPLRLWANDGNRLYYSFTDASAKVQMLGTYGYTRWYNIKMEVDLRAGTRTLSVGTDSENMAQLTLPMTEAEAADWSAATLDRISTGAFAQYGGSLLLDDMKLSWERNAKTCALTSMEDGNVCQIYPVTTVEAVKGLKDYMAAYVDNYIREVLGGLS